MPFHGVLPQSEPMSSSVSLQNSIVLSVRRLHLLVEGDPNRPLSLLGIAKLIQCLHLLLTCDDPIENSLIRPSSSSSTSSSSSAAAATTSTTSATTATPGGAGAGEDTNDSNAAAAMRRVQDPFESPNATVSSWKAMQEALSCVVRSRHMFPCSEDRTTASSSTAAVISSLDVAVHSLAIGCCLSALHHQFQHTLSPLMEAEAVVRLWGRRVYRVEQILDDAKSNQDVLSEEERANAAQQRGVEEASNRRHIGWNCPLTQDERTYLLFASYGCNEWRTSSSSSSFASQTGYVPHPVDALALALTGSRVWEQSKQRSDATWKRLCNVEESAIPLGLQHLHEEKVAASLELVMRRSLFGVDIDTLLALLPLVLQSLEVSSLRDVPLSVLEEENRFRFRYFPGATKAVPLASVDSLVDMKPAARCAADPSTPAMRAPSSGSPTPSSRNSQELTQSIHAAQRSAVDMLLNYAPHAASFRLVRNDVSTSTYHRLSPLTARVVSNRELLLALEYVHDDAATMKGWLCGDADGIVVEKRLQQSAELSVEFHEKKLSQRRRGLAPVAAPTNRRGGTSETPPAPLPGAESEEAQTPQSPALATPLSPRDLVLTLLAQIQLRGSWRHLHPGSSFLSSSALLFSTESMLEGRSLGLRSRFGRSLDDYGEKIVDPLTPSSQEDAQHQRPGDTLITVDWLVANRIARWTACDLQLSALAAFRGSLTRDKEEEELLMAAKQCTSSIVEDAILEEVFQFVFVRRAAFMRHTNGFLGASYNRVPGKPDKPRASDSFTVDAFATFLSVLGIPKLLAACSREENAQDAVRTATLSGLRSLLSFQTGTHAAGITSSRYTGSTPPSTAPPQALWRNTAQAGRYSSRSFVGMLCRTQPPGSSTAGNSYSVSRHVPDDSTVNQGSFMIMGKSGSGIDDMRPSVFPLPWSTMVQQRAAVKIGTSLAAANSSQSTSSVLNRSANGSRSPDGGRAARNQHIGYGADYFGIGNGPTAGALKNETAPIYRHQLQNLLLERDAVTAPWDDIIHVEAPETVLAPFAPFALNPREMRNGAKWSSQRMPWYALSLSEETDVTAAIRAHRHGLGLELQELLVLCVAWEMLESKGSVSDSVMMSLDCGVQHGFRAFEKRGAFGVASELQSTIDVLGDEANYPPMQAIVPHLAEHSCQFLATQVAISRHRMSKYGMFERTGFLGANASPNDKYYSYPIILPPNYPRLLPQPATPSPQPQEQAAAAAAGVKAKSRYPAHLPDVVELRVASTGTLLAYPAYSAALDTPTVIRRSLDPTLLIILSFPMANLVKELQLHAASHVGYIHAPLQFMLAVQERETLGTVIRAIASKAPKTQQKQQQESPKKSSHSAPSAVIANRAEALHTAVLSSLPHLHMRRQVMHSKARLRKILVPTHKSLVTNAQAVYSLVNRERYFTFRRQMHSLVQRPLITCCHRYAQTASTALLALRVVAPMDGEPVVNVEMMSKAMAKRSFEEVSDNEAEQPVTPTQRGRSPLTGVASGGRGKVMKSPDRSAAAAPNGQRSKVSHNAAREPFAVRCALWKCEQLEAFLNTYSQERVRLLSDACNAVMSSLQERLNLLAQSKSSRAAASSASAATSVGRTANANGTANSPFVPLNRGANKAIPDRERYLLLRHIHSLREQIKQAQRRSVGATVPFDELLAARINRLRLWAQQKCDVRQSEGGSKSPCEPEVDTFPLTRQIEKLMAGTSELTALAHRAKELTDEKEMVLSQREVILAFRGKLYATLQNEKRSFHLRIESNFRSLQEKLQDYEAQLEKLLRVENEKTHAQKTELRNIVRELKDAQSADRIAATYAKKEAKLARDFESAKALVAQLAKEKRLHDMSLVGKWDEKLAAQQRRRHIPIGLVRIRQRPRASQNPLRSDSMGRDDGADNEDEAVSAEQELYALRSEAANTNAGTARDAQGLNAAAAAAAAGGGGDQWVSTITGSYYRVRNEYSSRDPQLVTEYTLITANEMNGADKLLQRWNIAADDLDLKHIDARTAASHIQNSEHERLSAVLRAGDIAEQTTPHQISSAAAGSPEYQFMPLTPLEWRGKQIEALLRTGSAEGILPTFTRTEEQQQQEKQPTKVVVQLKLSRT